MPYVFVTKQIRLENGPTRVGDQESDPELMDFLKAKLVTEPGNNFSFWQTDLPPRIVLNLLETKGFSLVGTTGIGQTYVATLYKED